MDNLTHSLVGLTVSKAGLERMSPYATVVCLAAANAADADVASGLLGDRWTLLHYHRGITHSIVGTIAIGLLIPIVATAIERAGSVLTKRKPRIRFRALLLVSMIAAATHPLLDWTNNYGVRPFLPWSGRWLYADVFFIADPYIWLLLGVPAFLLTSNTRLRLVGWTVLGILIIALMGLASLTPALDSPSLRIAVVIWIVFAFAAGWLRTYGGANRFGPKLAVAAMLALAGYWGALALMHRLAATNSRSVAEQVAAARGERFIRVATMPTLASALRWQAVAETDKAMYRFMVTVKETNAELAGASMSRFMKPSGPDESLVRTAEGDRRAQTLLGFARFPLAQVNAENCAGQTLVQFADLRYTEPGRGRGNFSVNIPVDCPAR